MRRARICPEGCQFYHVMSRTVAGTKRFDGAEKEFFRRMMRAYETFCGVRVLTYAVMGTHFHILLEVPERELISEHEVVRRMRAIYTAKQVDERLAEWARWREQGNDARVEAELEELRSRMVDLSQYMKTLKQRFTQWYNARRERRGTLWEDRFKSVLVEGGRHALLAMSAYIDLNALRAGVVEDPKDYRWCGYAEALAGERRARAGLGLVYDLAGAKMPWESLAREYRMYLFGVGQKSESEDQRAGFSPERVRRVIEENGRLAMNELLRCRVRYFSDGLVLGSREFVNAVFEQYRENFGPKRREGARRMCLGDWDGLCTARALRLEPVRPPG